MRNLRTGPKACRPVLAGQGVKLRRTCGLHGLGQRRP